MADVNNTVRTKVELDSTSAQQEIAKLNAIAADGTKTLKERIDAKNKAAKLQEDLSKRNIANLEKEINSLSGVEGQEKKLLAAEKKLNAEKVKLTKNTANNEKATNKLNQSLDDSKSASVALDKASMGLSASLKALAANPLLAAITLIIGAIGLLKEAFTSSEEGQDKWNKLMTIASTIVGNFVDLLADFADMVVKAFENPQKAISDFADLIKENITNRFEGLLELIPNLGKAVSLLFKGEFSEAGKVAADAVGKVALGIESITDSINEATEAVGNFIKEQEREIEVAKRIADQRAAADKVERALIVGRAKADRDRAEALEKSIDKEKFTIEERIGFLKEASRIEQDITNREIKAAKLRLNAKIQENSLARSNKEALDEEANLRAKIIQLETARLTKQKEVTSQIIAFKQEEKAEQDKINAAKIKADETEIARLKLKGEETFELEKALLEKKQKFELDNLKLTREEKIAINSQYDLLEEQLQAEKESKEAEKRAREESTQQELDALDIERRRLNGENVLQLELELLERKRLQDIAAKDLTESQIQLINERALASKNALSKAQLEADKKAQQSLVNNALNGAAEIFGITQEVAVAKMIMAAPEAVANSFKTASAQYAPPLSGVMGALGAATVIVPIIKGLNDIKKARFGRGRSSGSSGSSGSASSGVSVSSVSSLSANNAARVGIDPSIGINAEISAANRIAGSSASNVVFSESSYSDFQRQTEFREDISTV